MIELDYSDIKQVDEFIDGTKFFIKSISLLREEFENARPKVIGIGVFKNNQQDVSPAINQITIEFSQPMSNSRNFDYGPLGEEAVVRFKKEIGFFGDDTKDTFEIEDLLPDKRYKIEIGLGFQDKSVMPLKPYLIDFKTGKD